VPLLSFTYEYDEITLWMTGFTARYHRLSAPLLIVGSALFPCPMWLASFTTT
jgi:hypothetical protein